MTTTPVEPARPAGEARPPTDSSRPEINRGGLIAFVFFGLFLGWAAFAPLDAGAYASGQITVLGSRQAVQHREGGTVAVLHAAEGDRVAKDQVVLEISVGDTRAVERGVAGQVVALLAQRSRMIAERDRLAAVPTPAEYADLIPEDLVIAGEALRIQRQEFDARDTGRGTRQGVLGQRVAQLEQQIQGLNRQIAANARQRTLIEEELAGMRSLADRGYAPLNRVRALERNAAQLEGEDGSLSAQVARAREAIGETELQMVGINTDLDEDVSEQLRQVEVQLNELQPRLIALRDTLERSQVRAPVAGTVVGLTIFTEGGVVQAGQTLMEIVPDNASLIISATVSPTDADNLQPGMDTQVRFAALRDRNLPIIHGEVRQISADSFTDENSGQQFFRAEVEVPRSELDKLGEVGDTLRPGLPVEVVVPLRKRTALSYLIEPLTQTIWRSGREE